MGETLAELLKLITTKPTPAPYAPPGSPAVPSPDFRVGTNPPFPFVNENLPFYNPDRETIMHGLAPSKWTAGSPGSDFAWLQALLSMPGFDRTDKRLATPPVFYAEGGIATRPHMGVVAERGPEAIIPLSKLGDLGGSTYNINIRGGGYGADEIGRQVVRAIQEYERRNGTAWRS